MTTDAPRTAIIPTLRYRDAPKAIDWLCDTFGFDRHMVVDDGAGGIVHAQLTLGDGMIMVGSARDDAFGKLIGQPTADHPDTQCAYVIVEDIKGHFAKAQSAGAEIVMPLEAQNYGGHNYAARDLEGHLWSFGDYNPYAAG